MTDRENYRDDGFRCDVSASLRLCVNLSGVAGGGCAAGRRRGVTLIELMVAMLASSILFLAISGVLASSHKQWNQTYDRVYGDIVTDAYTTRITFDRIVRQASMGSCYPMFAPWGAQITLYLYTNVSGTTTPPLNRYARFNLVGQDLLLEQGDLDTAFDPPVCAAPDSTQTLAHHVQSCWFWRSGPCIHMQMTLNDGKTNLPVAVTATRQNP